MIGDTSAGSPPPPYIWLSGTGNDKEAIKPNQTKYRAAIMTGDKFQWSGHISN